MRRLAAALVLLAVSGTSARGQAPYSVRWGDAASVVAAGVVALIPEATKLPKSGPSCGSTAPCDPASLPGFDRFAWGTELSRDGSAGTVACPGPQRCAALRGGARCVRVAGLGREALSHGRPGRGGARNGHRLVGGEGASDRSVTAWGGVP